MNAKVSKKGLYIPKEMLKGMNEVIILRKENELIIRPKHFFVIW